MIISKLAGGLGNQIFQWAFAKSLSVKYGVDYYLDLHHFDICNDGNPVKKHYYTLDKLPNFKYLKPNNVSSSTSGLSIQKDNMKGMVMVEDGLVYKNFDLEAENLHHKDFHYYFHGYWQCDKYFSNITDIVREEISPDNLSLNKLKNKYSQVLNNSVSLHFRRTNYLNSNLHFVLPVDYYSKGLEIIKDYENILVFSDDIEWCKNNLNYKNMTFIEGNTDVEDLWLMSMCNNNIIVNSSFSWWASWLNSNENKKIIAPSKWFEYPYDVFKDIYRSDWIVI